MWDQRNGSDIRAIDDEHITLFFSDVTTLVAEQLGFSLV
jgi:hypothetical protein